MTSPSRSSRRRVIILAGSLRRSASRRSAIVAVVRLWGSQATVTAPSFCRTTPAASYAGVGGISTGRFGVQ